MDRARHAGERDGFDLEGWRWPGFSWTGELLVAAHYWIMPFEHVLADLEPTTAEQIRVGLLFDQEHERLQLDLSLVTKLADALEGLAMRVFRYPDKTAYGADRKDFVISRISNGQAILISDLRPTDRRTAHGEMASQAIILDIGLTSEERGRIVRRCTDIASARTLAFREFPYVDALTTAINSIGRKLNQCNSEILDVAHRDSAALWTDPDPEAPAQEPPQAEGRARYALERTLRRLRQLSINLSTLNAFITQGVTGAQVASQDYRRMVEERAKSLRETPLGGFQTLDAFLSRFFSTSDGIDRMAVRYDTLRRRVAEYSQLVRAEIELLELKQLQNQAGQQVDLLRRADVLGAIGIYLALLAIFQELTPDQANWPSIVDLVMIGIGAVGSLTLAHAIWKVVRGKSGGSSRARLFAGLGGFFVFAVWMLTRS